MANKYFIILLFLLGFISELSAREENFYYENAVYDENIKTVLMHRDGFELSNPVYEIGEATQLILKFDDLSGEVKNYYYTIIHCDADWNESYIPQSDYLEGFAENPLDDYARSFNTSFDYINYRLFLPNDDVDFNYSGNYALVVYEDGNKENIVLSKRFYVVEPLVDVEGTVRRATLDAFMGENHEVDFTLLHENLKIENPNEEVKVVIMQNNRWDNAIRDLKPLFIRDRSLVYDYNRENVFVAGNEFRYFDNRTNRVEGENVLSTDFHRPYFHKTLMTDEPRANKKYFEYEEMNGKYVVESQDREVEDFDTECDYTFVHFSLPLESILLGGSVNVFGALSNWNANKSNEMTWNFDTSAYELTLLLKQGYYNYMYVYVPQGSAVADHKNIEGSFWQTENDYQIFVYYHEMGSRYDRLVGYRQLNSMQSRR
ncbi:protein of unknown function [Tangfeifania diversioriginum]|uniref:Type 9 secretion system plug protein N-terminal domain-containing protein n=1 Tax=Tangfeifania diversioriginum TaxID=1168035 RepID=A0A1M6NRT7_9BACT|nr:DUF5103 domain-containing protein [Tangfeifania diversioriginum]SHJ98272.1 protein of unknown function [Tangfeifania diversioriginum]